MQALPWSTIALGSLLLIWAGSQGGHHVKSSEAEKSKAPVKVQGAMLPWREHDDPQKEHVTVWTVFPASSKYFDPSPAPFMINYIVDDMDALLNRLKQEGVKVDDKRMDESYGRFAWIYDSDGNKIELWQPLP
jgi:catechol 2,3-dioxygenase-like lactoylglutathione lyase family enzyme